MIPEEEISRLARSTCRTSLTTVTSYFHRLHSQSNETLSHHSWSTFREVLLLPLDKAQEHEKARLHYLVPYSKGLGLIESGFLIIFSSLASDLHSTEAQVQSTFSVCGVGLIWRGKDQSKSIARFDRTSHHSVVVTRRLLKNSSVQALAYAQ